MIGMRSMAVIRQIMLPEAGMCEGIFPRVERLLKESSDHEKALQFVSASKRTSRYQSMVDFLFCEIWISHRDRCFRFYSDKKANPQLTNRLKPEEIERYERWLLAALEIARQRLVEERVESWTKFRLKVLSVAV